jgi:hypothetical protein
MTIPRACEVISRADTLSPSAAGPAARSLVRPQSGRRSFRRRPHARTRSVLRRGRSRHRRGMRRATQHVARLGCAMTFTVTQCRRMLAETTAVRVVRTRDSIRAIVRLGNELQAARNGEHDQTPAPSRPADVLDPNVSAYAKLTAGSRAAAKAKPTPGLPSAAAGRHEDAPAPGGQRFRSDTDR